jgi:hypothetical protein
VDAGGRTKVFGRGGREPEENAVSVPMLLSAAAAKTSWSNGRKNVFVLQGTAMMEEKEYWSWGSRWTSTTTTQKLSKFAIEEWTYELVI